MIFEEAKVGDKGARALAARTYFPICPRVKLHSSHLGWEVGGGCKRQKKNPKGAWVLKDLSPK